jgi:hypothetical protein
MPGLQPFLQPLAGSRRSIRRADAKRVEPERFRPLFKGFAQFFRAQKSRSA